MQHMRAGNTDHGQPPDPFAIDTQGMTGKIVGAQAEQAIEMPAQCWLFASLDDHRAKSKPDFQHKNNDIKARNVAKGSKGSKGGC